MPIDPTRATPRSRQLGSPPPGDPEGNVNYFYDANGLNGWVGETADPVDGVEVFGTFTEARAALVKWMDGVAAEYKLAASKARQLRKADVVR